MSEPRWYDAAQGVMRLLRTADPSCLRLSLGRVDGPRGARLKTLAQAALGALGWRVVVDGPADVHVGADRPKPGVFWLAPASEAPLTGGIAEADAAQWALRLRYRAASGAPLVEDLSAARDERLSLETAARTLKIRAAAGAPNEAALTGYVRRLRAALADDLDSPAALQALWDALRPGALSPATQWAALRQADAWLALNLPL